MSEPTEREQRMEAEAKLALAQVELQMARAEAAQRVAILEQQLAAERELRDAADQTRTGYVEAVGAAHAEQVASLREELDLWRRDDREGLRRCLNARVDVIDRSAAMFAGEETVSAEMQALLDAQQRERAEVLAALDRL